MRRSTVLAAVLAVLAGVVAAVGSPPATAAESDFLWGVATSGYQSEGSAPDSNWRRYEQAGTSSIKDPYGDAVDFRHRYAEDIDHAKALGVKVFRFGVEWARIEPRKGVVDQTELAYYDDVVNHIVRAGMRPMITLDHWVYPGWVADQGGWDSDATVTDWLNNARRVVDRYKGENAIWITINEPTIYVQNEISNGGLQAWQAPWMLARLVTVHRSAYDLIHTLDPGAMVSSNAAYFPAGAQVALDATFVDHVSDKLDFVGLDYYYGASLDNISAVHGASGEFWKIDPQPDGIYYAMRYYARKFPDPALTRHPTDAVATYRTLIANHGVPAGYRPVKPPAFCSVVSLDSCLDPAAYPGPLAPLG